MRKRWCARFELNCDVKFRITFSFQWMFHVYGPPLGWKTSTMLFVKVMQDGISCFHLFRSYILFMRHRKQERAAKHYGGFTPILVHPNFQRTCVIVRAFCTRYNCYKRYNTLLCDFNLSSYLCCMKFAPPSKFNSGWVNVK